MIVLSEVLDIKPVSKPVVCPKCGESDRNKFYTNKKGYKSTRLCKECHKIGCKERWHARSWLDRWASRNYKYNVTKEYLIALYEFQEGKCAICGEEPKTQRGLHVDHNHTTGKVRGLLCHGCNTAIGLLKEKTELLSKAINYLKE